MTYTTGMEEMGPGRTGMVGKALALHYGVIGKSEQSSKLEVSTYRSLDVLKGLSRWNMGDVTGCGLGDGNDIRAISEEGRDVAEDSKLSHNPLEFVDHGLLISCYIAKQL